MRRVGMHAIQKDHLIYYQIELSENYQETSTNCVDQKYDVHGEQRRFTYAVKRPTVKRPLNAILRRYHFFSDYFLSFVRSF